jgi:hypothetical protein
MAVTGVKVGSSRRLYVSGVVEDTFRTGTAALSHIFEHNMESNHLQVKQDVVPGAGMTCNVATDAPTRTIPDGFSLNAPFVLPASELAMPLFLAKCFGASTDANTAGSHVITYPAVPGFLPGMRIEDHISSQTVDTSYDRLHKGVCVNSFKFTATNKGVAKISLGLLGSGDSDPGTTKDESTGFAKPTKYITLSRCRLMIKACATPGTTAWDAALAVGTIAAGAFPAVDAGAFTNISEYLESIEFEVDNAGTLVRQAGTAEATGLYCGPVFPGDRIVGVRFSAIQGTDLASLFRSLASLTYAAQNEYSILLDINSENANQAQMYAFPLCRLKDNPGGGTGPGAMKFDYDFEAKATYTGTSYQPIHYLAVNGDNVDYS